MTIRSCLQISRQRSLGPLKSVPSSTNARRSEIVLSLFTRKARIREQCSLPFQILNILVYDELFAFCSIMMSGWLNSSLKIKRTVFLTFYKERCGDSQEEHHVLFFFVFRGFSELFISLWRWFRFDIPNFILGDFTAPKNFVGANKAGSPFLFKDWSCWDKANFIRSFPCIYGHCNKTWSCLFHERGGAMVVEDFLFYRNNNNF